MAWTKRITAKERDAIVAAFQSGATLDEVEARFKRSEGVLLQLARIATRAA